MSNNDIYCDIAKRTDGDIYIGVVGPVRTGKSTFIKKFKVLLSRTLPASTAVNGLLTSFPSRRQERQ